MRKFIFLDIDGVLAGYDYLQKGKGFIDPEKCLLLNQLVRDTGAKVVISSSWGFNPDTLKSLRLTGFNVDQVIDGTEHLEIHYDYLCRGNSIIKWLIKTINRDEEFGFVIIDDDCDFLISQQNHFVQTNRETGITEDDINKCKEILEKKIKGTALLRFHTN